MSLLTDEELMALLPDAVRLPIGWRDTARAIESATIKKLNSAEPFAFVESGGVWYSYQDEYGSRVPVFTHPPAPSAVEGYQLVPIELTEEMHVAAVREIVRCTGNDDFPRRVWAMMLAAARSE